jgi:hypothetical protein
VWQAIAAEQLKSLQSGKALEQVEFVTLASNTTQTISYAIDLSATDGMAFP